MASKFFLISQVFYPDEVSTAGLFTDLCAVLAEKGIETEVWCAQPSYSHCKRQPRAAIHKGIKIKYLASTNFYKDSLAGRFLNILTFSTSVFFKILFSPEKGKIFTHTTPPTMGIFLSFVCRFRKRKLDYILLDIFPEGLVRLGKTSYHNPLVRFWHNLFKSSLRKCNRIIVIGRDMQKWISEIVPECTGKILYIPHWQSADIIRPEEYENNRLVKQYNLENNFTVQYSGNMGLWNDMETIGHSVTMLPDIKFMLVGGGVRRKELFKKIPDDHPNVVSLPFQPSGNLSCVLSACHAAIVSMRNGLEGMAVPCKIYGILAAGKPVIALVPEKSEIAMVVREEKCGIVVEPGDTDGFVNAVKYLLSNELKRKEMGENARRSFIMKYSTDRIAERYIKLLNE